MDTKHISAQQKICKKYGADFVPSLADAKVGVSLNVKSDIVPVNGVRHVPVRGTTGWYIWAGEHLSNEDEFFKPLHVSHLEDWRPEVIKYLGLAPGWRFLIAGDYEDVWFDPTCLVP